MRKLARLVALCLAVAAPARADDVVIFAAASLKTALDALGPGFEAETGHRALVSYAGSSQLARQIEAGAPADLFLSADTAWMDVLEASGRLVPGTRRDLLGNRLVLVAHDPDAGPLDLADPEALPERLGTGRLAIALVDAVPAGRYGKAALTALGAWDAVAPRLAETDNVRAALALVATGAAPLGVVYATDAAAEPRVHIVAAFPETSHPPIVYPVALLAGHDTRAARACLAYLQSPAARAIFEGQGFAWLGD